jgi:type I restriction enzyme M protein
VAREEIAGQGYDLSIGRYKEIAHEEVEHGRSPREIIFSLKAIEEEIQRELSELEEMIR